jgi:hypothetical protein
MVTLRDGTISSFDYVCTYTLTTSQTNSWYESIFKGQKGLHIGISILLLAQRIPWSGAGFSAKVLRVITSARDSLRSSAHSAPTVDFCATYASPTRIFYSYARNTLLYPDNLFSHP